MPAKNALDDLFGTKPARRLPPLKPRSKVEEDFIEEINNAGPPTKAKRGRLAPPLEVKPEKTIELIPIDLREFTVKLEGISPLIVHRFSEKAKKQIEDKQQQRAKEPKGARDPHAEYLASLYPMPGFEAKVGKPNCKYGIKAVWFKLAAVAACRFTDGLPMTKARGAFHVLGESGGLVELHYKSLRSREDPVTIGQGSTRDMRYRGEFSDWWVNIRIRYNHAVISPDQIVNLLNVSGFSGGVGEMRPSQKCSDQFGMYTVSTEHVTTNGHGRRKK